MVSSAYGDSRITASHDDQVELLQPAIDLYPSLTGANLCHLLSIERSYFVVVEIVHWDQDTMIGGGGPPNGCVSTSTDRKLRSRLAKDLETVCNILGGLWRKDTPW